MDYDIKAHTFQFLKPGGTSRGVLYDKQSWFVVAKHDDRLRGVGECSLIKNLSPDRPNEVTQVLSRHLNKIDTQHSDLDRFPAVRFAIESLSLSVNSNDPFKLFDTPFSRGEEGIEINGLIWMGTKASMLTQIKEKIANGYKCLKLKIGAIDFNDEISLLKYIRQQFGREDLELRVDANGAFHPKNALEKLNRLANFDLHSIEQPILPNQWDEMAALCASSPLPIALDEELIGISNFEIKKKMLQTILPHYIILKPSLVGGLSAAKEWIELAISEDIGWWITSALEGNVGLNTIAQWTSTLNPLMPQGLGTGGLYTNNIGCPLEIRNGFIWYNKNKSWDLEFFKN